ncbi:MAG: type II secretion system protein [Acidobacteriota bacterium]
MRSGSGFTVLEILVTLALVSIIGAISLYSYQQFRPRLHLTNTAREVMAFIHRARLTAIRTHNTVTISVETELGADGTTYNPTGIRADRLILSRVDAFGNTEELSSYQLPKSFPPIYVWGDGETTVHGASSVSFSGDSLTINSDGTVSDTGAFRFSYPKDGTRNILEVAVLSQAGSPQIRKFLAASDRPSALSSQEYFTETTAAGSTQNLWVWY